MIDIAGMMVENLFSQRRRIDMCIDFSSTYILMPEHCLNGPKVSSTLQKSRREAMPKRVWRDGFTDARILGSSA
jgi:hypothetical protein